MSDFMSNYLYLLLPSGISVLVFYFLFRIIRNRPEGYRHAKARDLVVLCFLLLYLILYFSLVSTNEGFYRV